MTGIFISAIIIEMKDLRFMSLWDIYQPLFTSKQRDITNLYFNYDLSLTEIAEEKGCSKQGVSDCLAICRKKLEEYEEKLHLASLLQSLESFVRRYPEHREEIERILESGKGGE